LGLLDEWFVTLNVDDNVGARTDFFGRFLYAVGTAFMIRTGHNDTTSESLYGTGNPFVVSGDIYLFEYGRSLFVYSLDDRFASQNGQRFAWKTRRGVARRDDSNEFHIV
jgi:hypothetical protein